MPADPMLSEGARLERKTVRARLRRMKKEYKEVGDERAAAAMDEEINWMLERHLRYEQKAGGLGHK
jgi:hypothetical protein